MASSRQGSITDEATSQILQSIDAVCAKNSSAGEVYSALIVELMRQLASGSLKNPKGIGSDPERPLHTVYEFDENGVMGFYSSSPANFVLLEVQPNPEFFAGINWSIKVNAA
jgi:hypothetical protein